ncbi:hypothetical protein [Aridibaculum aurantiacum]|uniref:hypothetical protein n=1 Tax=Aridibaculum aurantiacum TaxID=2810307 RepID=UPI001A967502|nr:hypothetical protein [Aridibaculum aurantiacum]
MMCCFQDKAMAQVQNYFEYEEVSVAMHVPRIGHKEIPAVVQGQTIFLSFSAVFDFLRLKNNVSPHFDSISGFFIHPKSRYLVNRQMNHIIYEDVVYNLKPNTLLRTESDLYLRSDYFGEIFGLACNFNFRSLAVTLDTKVDLPAIREMQQEQMRKNIAWLKNKVTADTVAARSPRSFRLGMLDYGFYGMQESHRGSFNRFNLSAGANIFGGEANVQLWYSDRDGLDRRQQFYRWRMVNNQSKLVKQLSIGRVMSQPTSTVFAPINGIQISNTPTTYRKSFGSYRLNYTIEPEWTVELYVNNILINYTKSDASGFFSFDVPLVYGNTVVTLRAYGPYGEERVREETINIPFNFLPVHELEYNLSAGIVDDDKGTKFSRANINYGFTRRVTVGAGVEYMSSVYPRSVMPFVNVSARFGKNILVNAEHMAGVRTKGYLSYRLPSAFQLELDYTKYEKGQTAVNVNFFEERKAGFSYMLRTKKFAGFTKLAVVQHVFPKHQQMQGEWVVSGVVAGVSSNLTTTAVVPQDLKPWINTNLSLNFRLPAAIRFSPQVRYDFREKAFTSIRTEFEKRVTKNAFATFAYQHGQAEAGTSFSFGFRYNFSFAQVAILSRKLNNDMINQQTIRGSVLFDDKTKVVRFREQSSVGRGAVTVIPFIDLNANGKRDKGEPRVAGLKLHVNGGRVEKNTKDTSVTILGLEPYTEYLIECNPNSFDNISWRIQKPNIQVTVEPNLFKLVEVPILIAGEVSGNVYLDKKRNGGIVGIGRMFVNIYKNDTTLVAKTLTEPDGYFSYLGLSPGDYSAAIDVEQMAKLNFCCPQVHSFSIKPTLDGDIADGIDFNITSWDTIPPVPVIIVPPPAPVVVKDTVAKPKPVVKEPKYTIVGFIPAPAKANKEVAQPAASNAPGVITGRKQAKVNITSSGPGVRSQQATAPVKDVRNKQAETSVRNGLQNSNHTSRTIKPQSPTTPVAQPPVEEEVKQQRIPLRTKAKAAIDNAGSVNGRSATSAPKIQAKKSTVGRGNGTSRGAANAADTSEKENLEDKAKPAVEKINKVKALFFQL